MQVKRLEDIKKVELTDVQSGVAFDYEGRTYIKSTEFNISTKHYTCVAVDNGELVYISSSTKVLVRDYVLLEVLND